MKLERLQNAKIGQSFVGSEHHLTLERVFAFSGGPFSRPRWPDRNLHTDTAKAKEAGLPGIIVSATQFQGFLIDLLIDLFGEDWFTTGTIETRVPKSLMLGDTVQAKVVLHAVEPSADVVTYKMDIFCDNQNGEHVLVGTASCRVPAGTPRANT